MDATKYPVAIAIGLGAVAGVYLLSKLSAAGSAVVDGIKGGAINPASNNNLAYRGVNGAGAAVTGDDGWNLGSKLFEWFNPSTVAAENAAIGKGEAPASSNSGTGWLTSDQRSFNDGLIAPTIGYEPSSWAYAEQWSAR